MGSIRLVYTSNFEKIDMGAGHPMKGDRCPKALPKLLDFFGKIDMEPGAPVSWEDVELFHSTSYVDKLKLIEEKDIRTFVSGDTPVDATIIEGFRWSASATLIGLEVALSGGIAFNPCGGWHHAERGGGKGFCVINDLGIAAERALEKGVKKIAILDWDAHAGDGTEKGFKGNKNVFTVSIHQHPDTQYPYTVGYPSENADGDILNLPIMPGDGDDEFLAAVEEAVKSIRAYAPELLIVQAGVDLHERCYLSSTGVTNRGYYEAGKMLGALLKELSIGAVLTGGGGFVYPYYTEAWLSELEGVAEYLS